MSTKEDLSSKTASELKKMLKDLGIPSDDCFEKSDLIQKLQNAPETFPPKTANVTYGELKGLKIYNSAKPELVCIVLHGYGANAEDLSSVGSQILHQVGKTTNPKKIWFIHPNGILSLGGSSYAWWPLDMNRMMSDVMQGNWKAIFHDEPEGLKKARGAVIEMYNQLRKETGLPRSAFIFAGFSQGAMLSVDTVLHTQENEKELPKALVCWSGAFLAQELWTKKSQEVSLKGLKVIQSHGTQDPILPFQTGQLLRNFLEKCQVEMNFTQFVGPHTLGPMGNFTDLFK